MNYQEYISRIRFRFIKPNFRIPIPEDYYLERLRRILERGSTGPLEKLGVWLEFFNTVLPENEEPTKKDLRALCGIPKMSTLAIGAMINRGVQQMADTHAFVNIGVWQGFSFLCGMLHNDKKTCIGVDNFSEFGGPREQFLDRFNQYRSPSHHFYDMDYVAYFSRVHEGSIGFYIYDGGHSYQDQLRGLRIAEPFFSENCIILVDDTNWEEPREATLDFIAQSRNGYKILLDRRTSDNCHPTLWNGVMIFQRENLT